MYLTCDLEVGRIVPMLTQDERDAMEEWLGTETFAFNGMPNGELRLPRLELEIDAIDDHLFKTGDPAIRQALADHLLGLRALVSYIRENNIETPLRDFDYEELSKILLTAPYRSDFSQIKSLHPEWFITKGSWLWPPK